MIGMHTPGPWTVEKHGPGENGGIAIDATDPADGRDFEVCEVWGLHDDRVHCPVSRANARLIAAAPELLASCRQLVTAMIQLDKEHHREVLLAQSVIDRATKAHPKETQP